MVTSLVAQTVKRLPTKQETQVQSLGWEDLLEMEMVTHSSALAWKTPWMEEPGGLQSMGSQRVRHDWVTSLHFILTCDSLQEYFALNIVARCTCCMLNCFSCVLLFSTPWTVARQPPLSMRFSRQEYWHGLSCPPPGDLPDAGIEPVSLRCPALTGGFFYPSHHLGSPFIK